MRVLPYLLMSLSVVLPDATEATDSVDMCDLLYEKLREEMRQINSIKPVPRSLATTTRRRSDSELIILKYEHRYIREMKAAGCNPEAEFCKEGAKVLRKILQESRIYAEPIRNDDHSFLFIPNFIDEGEHLYIDPTIRRFFQGENVPTLFVGSKSELEELVATQQLQLSTYKTTSQEFINKIYRDRNTDPATAAKLHEFMVTHRELPPPGTVSTTTRERTVVEDTILGQEERYVREMLADKCFPDAKVCRGGSSLLNRILRENGINTKTVSSVEHTFLIVRDYFGSGEHLYIDPTIRQYFREGNVPTVFVGSKSELESLISTQNMYLKSRGKSPEEVVDYIYDIVNFSGLTHF